MKIIRASEIGVYQFCQRAWWYQQHGYESENKAELAGGSEVHEKHTLQVITSNFIQVMAYGLLLLAILSAIIWFIQLKL